jgi:hypothetical protein
MRVLFSTALIWILLASGANAKAPERNGFSLQPATIPIDEILKGGSPRDGIPALDHPSCLRAGEAPWQDVDLVLGVARRGEARAYPALEVVRAGGVVEERFDGRAVRVSFDSEGQVFRVFAPDSVEVVQGYWFAWTAFHPDTSVFVFNAP